MMLLAASARKSGGYASGYVDIFTSWLPWITVFILTWKTETGPNAHGLEEGMKS